MEVLGINWKPELRLVANLKKWDKNPRKITDSAYARLKRKVQEEGMHQVLTIDTENTVLSGNQRLQILIEVGIEEVWVMVPERDLTEREKEMVGVQANLSEGMWDIEKLKVFDVPMLLNQGFSKLELSVTPPAETTVSTSGYQTNCPHCNGGLRLSNRVKKIEKI